MIRQKFDKSDVGGVDNKVNIVTNLSHSATPALFLLAAFIVFILLIVFIIVLITHFLIIETVGFWITAGIMSSFGFCSMSFLGAKGAGFWIDTYTRFVEAKGQKQRNAILAITPDMIAYNHLEPVAIAGVHRVRELTERTGSEQNTVEGSAIDITNVPNFQQLLPELQQLANEDKDKPASEKRIHLGFTANGPRILKFEDVRSTAVSGVQGFGKTVTLAFLVLQAVLHGFKIVLCDPHANNAQGLANKVRGIGSAIVRSAASIELLSVLEMVWNELLRRKSSDSSNDAPWLIVLDELPAMIREHRGSEGFEIIDKTLTAVNDEGRKYGMFLAAGSQRWKQTSVGKADLRQSFPTQICHRNAVPEVALFMSCTNKEAIDGSRLPKGQAFVNDSVEFMTRTQFPYTTEEDSYVVGKICGLTPLTALVTESSENHSKPQNVLEISRKPVENMYETSPEAALERFRELWYKNATKSEIFAEIFGNPKPGDNKAYKTARAAYDAMLVQILEEDDAAIEL
jgi:hypothetical protein